MREKIARAVRFLLAALMIVSHVAAQTAKKPVVAGKSKTAAAAATRPNVILFITDGLRHDAVTPETAPNIFRLRQQGVDFINSHALYPTVTTPNASAFATGHGLGDTGDFGNSLYIAGTILDPPNHKQTLTPFIENDLVLGDLNQRFHGNYLTEETLMDLARKNGYAVAVVGKIGPAAIQDIGQVQLDDQGVLKLFPDTVIVDDATGRTDSELAKILGSTPCFDPDKQRPPKIGVPLPPEMASALGGAGLGVQVPDRCNGQKESLQDNSIAGKFNIPGTLAPNRIQQQYFADAVTQAILPRLVAAKKPFFLVVWSRDPDGTQHNQGDSLNQLSPGINGPSSRAAIRNADDNLGQIIGYLKAANLYAHTDIVVAADHGFSTISKSKVSSGKVTSSYSSTLAYEDVKPGYLPPGFLAIDLAHELKEKLYDPDASLDQKLHKYQCVQGTANDNDGCPPRPQHPSSGNGLIGGTGLPAPGEETGARVIVAANGGSDLIYLPGTAQGAKTESDKQFARRVSEILLAQDYVDGVFVDDAYGEVPGTLRLSQIGLKGPHPATPVPAIIVNFKSFSLDAQTPQLGRLTRVEIADTTLQEGQGMHGSFSRADTFNNIAAIGPAFKSHYIDRAPVSNADVAVTLAEIMGLSLPVTNARLQGRIMKEALAADTASAEYSVQPLEMESPEGPGGVKTKLLFQSYDGRFYYDQACLLRTETTCK